MEGPEWLHVPIADIDVAATLAPLAFLTGDPTVRLTPGHFVRSTWTPDGPGSIEVRWGHAAPPGTAPAGSRLSDAPRGGSDRQAWVRVAGPGGGWLRARAPGLLGCTDSFDGFDPTTEPVRTLWRRHRGLRLTRSATLWHDLACSIVQQRISGRDAADQWRRLVRGLGTPHAVGGSPAPLDAHQVAVPRVAASPVDPVLVAPPDPRLVAGLSYADLHVFGIERARASTLIRAAREVIRVEASVDGNPQGAIAALGMVPGIGPWTLSCVQALTWADPDTVVVGDYGLPRRIAYALVGVPEADDARMIDLLEPFRPYRLVAARLLQMTPGPPRRAPRGRRMDIRTK